MKKVAKKNVWLGILAIVLVFGMTVVGCGNGDNNPSDSEEKDVTFGGPPADGNDGKNNGGDPGGNVPLSYFNYTEENNEITIISLTVAGMKESTENGSSVTIPAQINGKPVTTIGVSAFNGNQRTSITIPDSVISIGEWAFQYNQLTSVTIPNSVTTIGDGAFNQNQLNSITIPDSVTTIGNMAFANNQLTSATIPNSVTEIGGYAFYNNQLNSITIPDSITKIMNSTFENNQLTSVTIPDGVTTIMTSAFYNNKFTSVTIPNSVNNIEDWAFGGDNTTLTRITIGANIVFSSNSRGITAANIAGSSNRGFEVGYEKAGRQGGTYVIGSSGWVKQ